ncbi:MAG TPA: hypothetical protein VK509_16010 [Polyangiales bacterium]|nr:hypothetical protein [Polyangiales bacterium]
MSLADGARCGAERAELARRILDAVAGSANLELSVEVRIVDGAGTSAVVRLMRGAERIGVRRIEAASCDDALAAVVAVTALALSSTPQEVPATAPATAHASEQPAVLVERASVVEQVSAIERESEGAQLEPGEASGGRWRMLGGVGMDVGTVDTATIAIEAGAALRLAGGEARALVRYGVPTSQQEREEVAATASSGHSSSSLRADFAAAALDYCLGIDEAQWLGACGGLELALTRRVRVEQAAGGTRSEREELAFGLGPSAGLTLVLRAVPLQPQLALSAQWALVAAKSAARPIGVRAIFGGAVPF